MPIFAIQSSDKIRGFNAEIAQLVEHHLAKVGVASSSLVFRSKRLKIKQLSLPKLVFGRLICCEKPAPTPLEARLCSPTEQKPKTSRKKPETRKTRKNILYL